MNPPFSSLRAKLIAAFTAVIAISLLLASATFAYLLRQYQIQTEEDRLENIAAYNAAQETMACNAQLADAKEGMKAFVEKRPPQWRHE